MKIKTTKEIKRHSDYAHKCWADATDVSIELQKLANNIKALQKEISDITRKSNHV